MDEAIHPTWVANAAVWTTAVRSGAIASRRLATDGAIVAAATALAPASVLDLGCGEGWLARALGARGIAVTGIDGSAPLIAAAERDGGGRFLTVSYAEFTGDPARAGSRFDLTIANFALLQQDLAPLLCAVARVSRSFLLQTLHPAAVAPPYRDGWRREDFSAFPDGADWQPMPWYFRTIGSWVAVLAESGWQIASIAEPLHPETAQPLSLVILARQPP